MLMNISLKAYALVEIDVLGFSLLPLSIEIADGCRCFIKSSEGLSDKWGGWLSSLSARCLLLYVGLQTMSPTSKRPLALNAACCVRRPDSQNTEFSVGL